MKCQHCGKENTSDAKFCRSCGSMILKTENVDFTCIHYAGEDKKEERIIKNDNTKRGISFWAWLSVILLVFIIIYWLFGIGAFGSIQG